MKIRLLFVFIILFIIFKVFAQGEVQDSVQVVEKYHILIATSKSDFKQTLVEKITAKSDELNCESKIVKLKELNTEPVEKYDVIIILNSIWVFRMNKNVRKFFKNLDEIHRSKIILISTAQDRGWKIKEQGIFAITSASREEKVDTVTDSVFLKIKEILQIP